MPQKFAKVWSRKDGEGIVLEINQATKTINVMWASGHESEIAAANVTIGGRPRR